MLDTNVVVAGLLWHGTPRQLLERAIDRDDIVFLSSPILLAELTHTLNYRKFHAQLARSGASIETWLQRYQAWVALVDPPTVPRVVPTDPDDDHVIACAIAARADAIVSGFKVSAPAPAAPPVPATPAPAAPAPQPGLPQLLGLHG